MKKSVLMLLMLTTVLLQSCGFEIVDSGYVGLKESLGEVQTKEYTPGIHFYNPLTTSIFEMSSREKVWEGELSGFSKDNQIVNVNFKINYKPNSKQIAELYIALGDDYINKILPQRVTAPIKEVLGAYKVTNLSANRAVVQAKAKQIITDRLKGTNIEMIGFEITNYDYDDKFEEAVKAKIVAKEQSIAETFKTAQNKEKNKQRLDNEKTNAEAIKIKGAALAKNPKLVEFEAVQRWDGKLPQYMMGNTTPFIKIK